MSPPGSTHYQRLGLPPLASPEEVRQAFRRLSKQLHPDTALLPPAEAHRAFRDLQEAYAILSDPDRRRAYDRQLALAPPAILPTPPPPSPPSSAPRSAELSSRRPLSGGEWFALVLLGGALGFSLVLGVGLAWWRGMALLHDAPLP
ncbi:MAG: J domain-containing protein [Synechococcus sp. Tobar2m-G35]|nr:J domain-containing protein [Synechococcus sp. Tobar2m-G35]